MRFIHNLKKLWKDFFTPVYKSYTQELLFWGKLFREIGFPQVYVYK